MNSLLLTLPTFTAKNVQKPSNNQLSGYSSAPNMNYARMFGCRASAASDDGENSSLSSSVLMPKQKTKESILINENGSTNTGIGIVEFLLGKIYFITGGTGFLGKAIIEKLLRASPEVGKIYVLIKAANNEAAFKRLKTEIIDSDLFDCLRLKHGKYYENFMLRKLVYVCGNICESNLGMDPNSMDINSAANTSFDERSVSLLVLEPVPHRSINITVQFDVAVTINTKGPARLLNFAKKCKKLCIFIHISTGQEIMDGEMCMNTAKQWVRHELSKRRKKKSQLLLYAQALLKALKETFFLVGYKEIGILFYFILFLQ
ncbi:hypothetical protein JRO89_XS03G0009000 [Xanthoceras sorbifolium]|uniref:Fatty acyl-CoA reductase n=1 Tax=Xanthoceras sorbifolium TaxID=99658 RepID=A0ABQ8I802_9ROSI|nr:hypothetical protein JRO89_XS03G0009000 [Xanthoceras sorbifolium]